MVWKPEQLLPGDEVGLIAPGGPSEDGVVERGVRALEELGFRVRLGRSVHQKLGFLAGTDAERAADIVQMFREESVKALFCVRGGTGCTRLLSQLPYGLLKKHRKPFIGLSDTSALLLTFLQRLQLVTFHGPMISTDLMHADCPAFTKESLLRAVGQTTPIGSVCGESQELRDGVQVLRRGKAEGRVIATNLFLLTLLIGTKFVPSLRGAILCLEEVNEAPYRIDRMLTALHHNGVFKACAAVVVGRCEGCIDKKPNPNGDYRQTVFDVFSEHLSRLAIPVLYGVPFGHTKLNSTLPLGISAEVDAGVRDLFISEGAVRVRRGKRLV